MKSAVRKLVGLSGANGREAAWLLFLSACGWLYFAYAYLCESGLGVAVPRYAGY
jgi:hypothetical protein